MEMMKYWVRTHQLTAFFLVTFGITFGLWFCFDPVMNQGIAFLVFLMSVAICGPGLAGIIISRISSEEPAVGSIKTTWMVFLVALILATLVFLANNIFINRASFSPVMAGFVMLMAIPVAFIISQSVSRVPSVRQYLNSIIDVRPVWRWVILALIVPAGLNILSIWISNLLGRQSISISDLSFRGFTLTKMIVITFLYQIFFFNLTGEEAGWRGFALPRLQAQTNPLITSLILTFVWSVWHFFYWEAGGDPVLSWKYWGETLIRLFPATVLINWFYNHSKGSILVAGVTHAAANTAFAAVPQMDWPVHTAIMYKVAFGLILVDQMWQKLDSHHPAVIRTSKTQKQEERYGLSLLPR